MPLRTPHDTELYTLGRGIVTIATFVGDTPGAYTDVGNCPRFDVNVSEETLEHYSHRTGTKTRDKVVTLEKNYSIEFDLDEKSRANLAMFLQGTVTGNTIYGLQANDARYAIKFTSDNAAGENQIWDFWRVKLSPASAHALIGDDWSIMSFSGEGESDETNHSESPYFTVEVQTTTSTTSTTTTS